jgi:ABC-type glycerol-3-phosphate transport system substrate-binding protein
MTAAGAALAACVPIATPPPAAAPIPTPVSEKVTIRYWRHPFDPEVNTARAIAKTFMEKNPNIEVVLETYPDYETKIRTAIAGGVAPDIMGIDSPLVASYAYEGAIIPLDDYYATIPGSKEDLIDAALNALTWRGHIWAGPLNESNVGIWYGRVPMEKAGITPPDKVDDAWTWDQLLEAAKKLTLDANGRTAVDPDFDPNNVVQWGILPSMHLGIGEGAQYVNMTWIWQNGGEILSPDATKASGYFDSPASIEALQWWGDLFNVHHVAPMEGIPEGIETGKIVMWISGPWMIGYWRDKYPDFQYGLAPLAYNKRRVSPSGSWNMAITKQSKHPDEAWLYIDAVTGKEGSKIWYEQTRNLPARKSTYEAFPDLGQYPMNIFSEQLQKYAHPRPVTPAYPVVTDSLGKAFDDVQHGKPAAEAAAEFVAVVDRALAKYK